MNYVMEKEVMKFRAVIPVLVICLGILASGWGLAATHTASEVVKNTSSTVIERLKLEKAQLDAHPERIYSIINELVIPHFDFHSMSRFVLGGAWNQATQDQQKRFVEEFKTLLVRTYANALREYSDNEIRYYPEQSSPESSLVVVRTEVQVTGAPPVPIQYRMHNGSGQWKVVDVSLDGVSLVSTYRGSFASEIRKSGLDYLITRLVERNERNEVVQ
jgi:phospholipid transport system substrate-binding protein